MKRITESATALGGLVFGLFSVQLRRQLVLDCSVKSMVDGSKIALVALAAGGESEIAGWDTGCGDAGGRAAVGAFGGARGGVPDDHRRVSAAAIFLLLLRAAGSVRADFRRVYSFRSAGRYCAKSRADSYRVELPALFDSADDLSAGAAGYAGGYAGEPGDFGEEQ